MRQMRELGASGSGKIYPLTRGVGEIFLLEGVREGDALWALQGSNLRPADYESAALTN